MENEDYVGHWLSEISNELDETNIHIIHDTLRANHFTTRFKLKLITNEQLEVMFSGSNKLGLGTMAVLKLKLSQLNEESLLVKGKHDLTKGKPMKTVYICTLYIIYYICTLPLYIYIYYICTLHNLHKVQYHIVNN